MTAGTKRTANGARDDATPDQLLASDRPSLGELLLRARLIDQEQLEAALDEREISDGRRERLGEAVARLGYATEAEIALELAGQLRLDFVGADELLSADAVALKRIPAGLAERYGILPLRVDPDGALMLACADPTNFMAVEDARLLSGAPGIRVVVATRGGVAAAVRKLYATQLQDAAGELVDSLSDRERDEADEEELAPSDAPVIRLANGIISEALQARASDIHIEPGPTETVVRYRIDGVLHQAMSVPRSASGPLISRVKLMSGMDIAERRRPQDGRTRFQSEDGEVDLRVSTIASLHGEDIVIRLLRKGVEQLQLNEVGLSSTQHEQILGIIERPQGLVLVTGPTGSGKTSTMYAFLSHLVREETKIITVEDPVEYELRGVNQTQVHERIGFTFARALRTVLRQDPDVVMLGEIRDAETAELALQASLTGHLVLSTLHTNDAPGAVVRLRDLGIPAYLIASSLSLIVGQRLVRAVCESCAEPETADRRVLEQLGLAQRDLRKAHLRAGGGCAACGGSGYLGRHGLFEILPIDAAMRELVSSQVDESELRSRARATGMRTLREDGIAKACEGLTTLSEVLRVTPTDDQ